MGSWTHLSEFKFCPSCRLPICSSQILEQRGMADDGCVGISVLMVLPFAGYPLVREYTIIFRQRLTIRTCRHARCRRSERRATPAAGSWYIAWWTPVLRLSLHSL